VRFAPRIRITRSRLSSEPPAKRDTAEGTQTRDVHGSPSSDIEVVAKQEKSEGMSDVSRRLEQVSRHLEQAQQVLDDVNRVVRVADNIHAEVQHSRHTVRNLTIAGLVVLAVGIAVFGTARTRN
jgi:hypothetical protein